MRVEKTQISKEISETRWSLNLIVKLITESDIRGKDFKMITHGLVEDTQKRKLVPFEQNAEDFEKQNFFRFYVGKIKISLLFLPGKSVSKKVTRK